MKMQLKYGAQKDFSEVEIPAGATFEDIYKSLDPQPELKVLAVRADAQILGLSEKADGFQKVEFLDIRSNAARQIYEHCAIMVYLKAVEETLGREPVVVRNSLSKGLFTEFVSGREITAEELERVMDCAKEIIRKDMPFVKKIVPREEGLALMSEADLPEKKRRVEANPKLQKVELYDLEGFVNYFYGPMLPSTGYLYEMSLRKYQKGVLLMHPNKYEGKREFENADDRKLYAAFREAQHWQEMQDVHSVGDLNRKVLEGRSDDIILLSEALQQKKIVEVTNKILESKKRVVLITGPSSSGKTTFARKLCIQLEVEGVHPLYLGTDDYFVEREDTPLDENGERNYENLEAVDIALFNDNINALLAGETVDLPVFDFKNGKKIFGTRFTSIEEGQPIVIEGIHALNDKLTPTIPEEEKFRIYISPLAPIAIDMHNRISVTDARMIRRMVRDYQFRGNSASNTIRNWPKVRTGEDKNVFPYNGKADVFFNSAHMYEIGVLRKYAQPLLEAIPKEDESYAEAVRLLHFLEFFETIEDDSAIPNSSILREFIGGSVFVK